MRDGLCRHAHVLGRARASQLRGPSRARGGRRAHPTHAAAQQARAARAAAPRSALPVRRTAGLVALLRTRGRLTGGGVESAFFYIYI